MGGGSQDGKNINGAGRREVSGWEEDKWGGWGAQEWKKMKDGIDAG